MSDLPVKAEEKQEEEKKEVVRGPDGRILPGSAALNPKGRPQGKTLKEFAREYLLNLPDDEKKAYLAELPKEIVWKMAEGNPHQSTDEKVDVTLPQPLLEAMRLKTAPIVPEETPIDPANP